MMVSPGAFLIFLKFFILPITGTVPHMIVVFGMQCKMLISPAIYFSFFQNLIFWVFQSSSINAKRKL